MENGAFEMYGEKIPGISISKEEAPNAPRRRLCSLRRLLLGVLLASALGTAAMAAATLATVLRRAPAAAAPPVTEPPLTEPGAAARGKFQFLHRLSKAKVYEYPGGEIQWARFRRDPGDYESAEVAAFGRSLNARRAGMTLGTLRIRPRGLRAPHWHFNANEHGYVVQGSAWIGILGPDSSRAVTYNVSRGQVVFFPRNSVHWIKNVGGDDLVLLLFFSTHQELLTLDADDVFFDTPEDIAARALRPEGGVSFIRTFRKAEEDQAVNLPVNLDEIVHNSTFPQSPDEEVWKYFYDLPASPEFPFPGGVFQWARYRKNTTGLTENQQIFSKSLNEHEDTLTLATLRIFGNHLGTPHFHFNANEMGVVVAGCGQVGLILPEGHFEFTVAVGDVVFFPLGSQHFIHGFCEEELRLVLAYSTGGQLETLRMNQYFPGTADHILAQLFSKDQAEFQKIPNISH